MKTVSDYYRETRGKYPTMPASQALSWARHSVRVDAILRDIEWEYPNEYSGPFAIGTLGNTAIAVYWDDDEPYDWGDDEPTEYDREHLTVIGLGVRVAGETENLDSCWGYSIIEDGTWWGSQWERAAVDFALDLDAFNRAETEVAERAEWAARDTITV